MKHLDPNLLLKLIAKGSISFGTLFMTVADDPQLAIAFCEATLIGGAKRVVDKRSIAILLQYIDVCLPDSEDPSLKVWAGKGLGLYLKTLHNSLTA